MLVVLGEGYSSELVVKTSAMVSSHLEDRSLIALHFSQVPESQHLISSHGHKDIVLLHNE